MEKFRGVFTAICLLSVQLSGNLSADEGMWPLNMVPQEKLQEEYGITLDQKWLNSVQLSCLRLSAGGSGSFVSPNGLIMTNHHVGVSAIYNLSSKGRNLVEEGFYAKSYDQELKCSGLYVDQLVMMRDITSDVNCPFPETLSPGEREKARKAIMTRLTEQAEKESGLKVEVVSLYQGGQYYLYYYKRYTDVRLVMAPEVAIAYFGGDEENFEYPRTALDVCFFRAYENGKPLKDNSYLKWSKSGPREGEPLFVAGHPGKTDRMLTASHISYLSAVSYPLIMDYLETRISALNNFAALNAENSRIASNNLFSLRNSEKVYRAITAGLFTGEIIENKKEFEEHFEQGLSEEEREPWKNIATALELCKKYAVNYFLLEGIGSRLSRSYIWAKQLLRAAEERTKPNDLRLREYTDSELTTLEQSLFSDDPFYPTMDQVLLTDALTRFERLLGSDNPLLIAILQGKTADSRARELILGSKLGDKAYRKALYENPEMAISSDDPMMQLARLLDLPARALRTQFEAEWESVRNESYTKISQLLFKRYGTSLYPDATFTLRLAIGEMSGYCQGGHSIAPMTEIEDAYTKAAEHKFQAPYKLPHSWLKKDRRLNRTTPFNFVSTQDIIGGNSGSPMVNKQGEVVGLIFDGNEQSLLWDFEFDQTQGRAISVHSQAILETLKHVYNASRIVDEIQSPQLK